jgi:hypothetical protein
MLRKIADDAHQGAVQRLAEIPGVGVDSAQQIIAQVGATAATFPSEKCLSSWVGACPGDDESAGVNYSHRSPKGNRQMRRILNAESMTPTAIPTLWCCLSMRFAKMFRISKSGGIEADWARAAWATRIVPESNTMSACCFMFPS